MATERVGIEINLMGYEEARSQMQNLDNMIRGLNGRRGYLRIKARVDELKLNKKALQAARVKVQADITDVDRKIQRIRDRIRRLQASKVRFNMDDSGVRRVDARIEELRSHLAGLGRTRTGLRDEFRQINNEIGQATAELNRYQAALRNAGMAGRSLGDIFKSATSKTAHLGQAMQSMGNAITRMTYPLRMFTSGALMGAGFTAMNKITEGLSSGFSRYDTMKKYPKIMAAFGYSAEEAQKSIDALDKSVRGLPTGLDEMVDMSQRFTATTGDIEKGTKLAIAANNAFLASMSTDTQRYQGMMQLQDVLGGKDMNAREWNSLVSSMTPAIVKMGESMGYTNKNMDEWIQKVRDGKVANDDFIDTLIKVGNEGGEVAKMANESKDTWQAFSANVSNAFSRMTAGVLQSLDEIVNVATGGAFDSLNMLLADKVAPGIDKMTASIKDWIKANPDKIMDFVDSFKSVDWKGLGKGFLTGMSDIAKVLKNVFDKLGSMDAGSLERIGRIIAWLPALGSALTIGGGIIKGTRHFIGGAVAGIVGFGRVIGAIASIGGAGIGAGLIGKAIANLKGLSLFSKVASGSKMARLYKSMKGLKLLGAIGKGIKPGAIIKGFLPAMEVIGGIAAIVTTTTGATALNTYLVKKSVDNILGITDGINDVFKSVNKIKDTTFNKDALRNSVNGMYDIYDILYGEKTGQKTRGANKAGTSMIMGEKGFGDMNPAKLKKSANSLKNMADMFKNMIGVMDMFDPLMKAISQTIGTQKGRGATPFTRLKELLTGENGLLASIKSIADEMDVQLGDIESLDTVPDTIENVKNIFDSLQGITDMVPALLEGIQTNVGTQVGRGTPFEKLANALTGENGMFSVIRRITESVYNELLGYKGGMNGFKLDSSMLEELSASMENVKNMFTHISDFVAMMPELQSNMAPVMGGGGASPGSGANMFTVLKNQINQMMSGIGEIVNTINTDIPNVDLEAKMSGLVKAVDNIKSVAKKLANLGSGEMASTGTASFTAIQNIKQMVHQLGNALNTETISSLQMQVAQFKASVDQIFETLNSDFEHVEVTVNIEGKVTGDDKLVSDINAARDRIMSAVRSIPSSITKHVYIHVAPHVSVGSFSVPTAADLGGTPHTGGMITGRNGRLLYRSKGGDIFGSIFKPKGTDTVPAMLTPGEYVMRKKAVDGFGVRFMQRVNQLDVAGAFRELSAKFGGIVTNNSGTYITNNITNNNSPTINQNINTNNPNFAFKRSNRYVMSL